MNIFATRFGVATVNVLPGASILGSSLVQLSQRVHVVASAFAPPPSLFEHRRTDRATADTSPPTRPYMSYRADVRLPDRSVVDGIGPPLYHPLMYSLKAAKREVRAPA